MNLDEFQKKNIGVFDWSDKSKINLSSKIFLNYTGRIQINFKENVQKTFSKNGYFLAGPFPQGREENADLTVNGRQYYVSKIYILAKEVVIIHEPFTNGSSLFLRIPIASADPKNLKYTCIDRLLSSTPVVSFQLNSLLKDGSRAAFYAGETTLFLETGISIQTAIPSKNAVNPFDEMKLTLFEPDYRLVYIHLKDTAITTSTAKKEGFSNPLLGNFKEGLENAVVEMDDDMECTPYDIGADNVQFMQVPIADETVTGHADKNTMFGVLYLFYMGIIVMALTFLAPQIVNVVISNVNENYKKDSNVMSNFKSLFTLFFACIFIFSVFMTLDGSERHNVAESKAGLVIFFLAFACSSIFVVYATVSGVLSQSDGSKWDIAKVFEFLFECLPFKKFSKVFTNFLYVFAFFCIIVLIDNKLLGGKYFFTSYFIAWGIFLSFTFGILIAYITGGIDLNESVGNNAYSVSATK